MKRLAAAALVLLWLSLGLSPVLAQSTIVPTVPGQNSNLSSAPIRSNFAAAYSDINGLLGMHAVASLGACSTQTQTIGADCLVTSSPTAYLWYKYTGAAHGYGLIATINPTTSPPTVTTGLPPIANGHLIANCSGAGAIPTDCAWTTYADQAISAVNGSIPYRTGGTWSTVSIGTSGGTIPLNNTANVFSQPQSVNLNGTALPSAQAGTLVQLQQANTAIGRVEIDTYGASAVVTGVRADGTAASPTTLVANDEIMSINAWGYDGTSRAGGAAALRTYAGGTWSNTSHPTYIRFAATAAASTTLTDIMHIGPDGVWIGNPSGGAEGAGTLNLASSLYNNGVAPTGTGGFVLATSPTLVTPALGAAIATSINGLGITTSTGTLTIANGKTLTVNNSLTFTGTDSTSFAFPGTSDTVVGLAATQSLTNKSLTSSTDVLGGVTMTLGSDADGDIYYRSGGVLTRLPIGANGRVLQVNTGLPSWQPGSSAGTVTVGSTTVASASATFGVLFNNNGTLGNTSNGTQGQQLVSNGNAAPTYQSGGWVLINTLTASASASLSDTTSLTATYSEYEIVFANIIPSAASSTFEFLIHEGGTFPVTGYVSTGFGNNTGGTQLADNPTTFLPLSHNATAANATPGISGSVRIATPSVASLHNVWGVLTYATGSGSGIISMSGYWNSSAVVDGFQVVFNSGTITSGTIKIYGRL